MFPKEFTPLARVQLASKQQDGRRTGMPKRGVLVIVDRLSLTRECIATSLSKLGVDWDIIAVAGLDDVTLTECHVDVLLLNCSDTGDLGEYLRCSASRSLEDMSRIFPILVIGDEKDPTEIIELLAQGVRGYVPAEHTGLDLLLKIVRLVKAGGVFVPPSTLAFEQPYFVSHQDHDAAAHELTAREREVFNLLRRGKANKAIAHELQLSQSTVKAHIQRLMRKLNATNRTEAVYRGHEMPFKHNEAIEGDRS